jgi:hypothetical protein
LSGVVTPPGQKDTHFLIAQKNLRARYFSLSKIVSFPLFWQQAKTSG